MLVPPYRIIAETFKPVLVFRKMVLYLLFRKRIPIMIAVIDDRLVGGNYFLGDLFAFYHVITTFVRVPFCKKGSVLRFYFHHGRSFGEP